MSHVEALKTKYDVRAEAIMQRLATLAKKRGVRMVHLLPDVRPGVVAVPYKQPAALDTRIQRVHDAFGSEPPAKLEAILNAWKKLAEDYSNRERSGP